MVDHNVDRKYIRGYLMTLKELIEKLNHPDADPDMPVYIELSVFLCELENIEFRNDSRKRPGYGVILT